MHKKRNKFKPTITHSESRQSIIVYYRLDKKKKEKEFRYKKKGYEQALEEATAFVEEIKLNIKADTDHQLKYLEVMHELLLKHGYRNTKSSTPNQPTASNEQVIEYDEYDDSCSDCDSDYGNIREYDSDDDKFYYD